MEKWKFSWAWEKILRQTRERIIERKKKLKKNDIKIDNIYFLQMDKLHLSHLSSSLNYRQLKDGMVAEIGCLTSPFPSFWLYCQIVFSACLVVMCRLRSSQRDLGRSDENYFQVWLIKTLYIGLPCSFHVCYLNAEDCRILGEGNMKEV